MHATASRVEARGLAPQFDEDLLRDLLGLGGIAHDSQHDAVHRRCQVVVELGERRSVVPGDPGHQRGAVDPYAARTTASDHRHIHHL